MTDHNEQPHGSDKEILNIQIPSGDEWEEAGENNCRCKEVSKMKPSEMLRLVIGDLAFWRKAKRYK
jgi:hypothetical protein